MLSRLSEQGVDFFQRFWSIFAQARMGSLERDALMLIWDFCTFVRSRAFSLSPFGLNYSFFSHSTLFFPRNLKLTPNLGIKHSYSNKDHKICKNV